MQEQEKTLQDYLAILSRRKVPMLMTMLAVFLCGIIIAMVWPPTYKSSATILIKEQEIPSELVMSTVTSFAAQRIQIISQRVMTRTNLMRIIDKYNLYVKDRKRYTTEEVLENMRSSIGLNMISADVVDPRSGRPTTATIAFTLSYEGDSPGATQKVAGELTSLFLAENLKNRKEKASQTYIFLTDESNKLAQAIAENEKKVAQFKQLHASSLPEMNVMNLSVLDRTEREFVQMEAELNAKEERIFYLESQLAQTNPLTNMRSATGQSILDPVSRLKALESEYASISAKYSMQHPDVIKIKREIDGLRKQTGIKESFVEKAKTLSSFRSELGALKKRYSAQHPDILKLQKTIAVLEEDIQNFEKLPEQKVMELSPDNPVYISIKGQVQSVKTEINALKERKIKLTVKQEEYEDRLVKAPVVERDYLILTRELNNTLLRFQEIKAKQMVAEIGQQLEKESKGESFVLIEPAQYPEKPVKPNRIAILFLALIFSVACGFGLAILQEGLDSSVRGVSGITKLLTSVPLAVIPMIYISQDYYRKRRITRILVSSAFISVSVVVLAVHFLWTPLDVLWFRGLRKAENVIGLD
jgi:uncharacterized protein involved in exopolysaccharide biosynthesis